MFGPGRRLNFGNNNNTNTLSPPPPLKRQKMNVPNVSSRVPTNIQFGPMYTRNIHPYRTNSEPSFFTFESCVRLPSGNYHYLLQPPQLNRVSESFSERATRDLPLERYNSIEALLQHPGVYTWILYADSEHPNNTTRDKFLAGKSLSPGEILSKHKNLFRNAGPNTGLLLAGEVRIIAGGRVEYNFISGTYMPSILTSYARRRRILQSEAIERMKLFMNAKWTASGATTVVFNPSVTETFVENTIESGDLDTYIRAGYTLSEPFASKDECKVAFRGAEIDRRATRNAGLRGGKGIGRRKHKTHRRRRV